MLAAKLGIAHTLCISFEVICLGANLLGHLGIGSVDGPQHAHEFFDFPFIQQALLDKGKIEKLVGDRKSTRLNSSHGYISYAVFCLKKKKKHTVYATTTHSH